MYFEEVDSNYTPVSRTFTLEEAKQLACRGTMKVDSSGDTWKKICENSGKPLEKPSET